MISIFWDASSEHAGSNDIAENLRPFRQSKREFRQHVNAHRGETHLEDFAG
jgi:hypothetical protein